MSVERLDSDVDDERVVGQLETKTQDVARVNDAPEVRRLSLRIVLGS